MASRAARLIERLRTGPPLVLDGAMGTYLGAQGAAVSGPLWSTAVLETDPRLVRAAHAAYVDAGAEVVTAVTFRAQPGVFAAMDRREEEWRAVVKAAVAAARDGIVDAGGPPEAVWVAGSLAPVADCYSPAAVPADDVLVREHGAQAHALKQAGVDLVLVETMNLLREARIAVTAARGTGLPVWCSFVAGPQARLLSGESLALAVAEVEALGVDAVLANCAGLENTAAAVDVLGAAAAEPWGVYANASSGDPGAGWGPAAAPDAFAVAARAWTEAGARIVGSCCRSGPAHTRAIAAAVRDRTGAKDS